MIYLIPHVTVTPLLLIELQLSRENGRGFAYANSPWHGHGQGQRHFGAITKPTFRVSHAA